MHVAVYKNHLALYLEATIVQQLGVVTIRLQVMKSTGDCCAPFQRVLRGAIVMLLASCPTALVR